MGLPAKLTEEEQALLDRYALLKKKVREVQGLKPSTPRYTEGTILETRLCSPLYCISSISNTEGDLELVF